MLAEIARIDGRTLDAEHLYEKAIHSANANGFMHNEAVANELAARFYAARGFETIADAYFRNSRYCYLRWGADGKVQQLDRLYPHLAAPEGQRPASRNATIGTPVGQLDAEAVARASQALSSEIVLPKLIERLMQIVLEHAGAERGLLILLRGSEPLIEAQATTGHGRVDVHVRQTEITSSDLPKSALHYAIRTQERVLLDDAATDNVYSTDEYVRQNRSNPYYACQSSNKHRSSAHFIWKTTRLRRFHAGPGCSVAVAGFASRHFAGECRPLYRSATPSWAAAASSCIRLDAQA